ncbi:hypothetical protein B7P43_G11740 [Cryptotermes secundus]|uniref:Uncharacterized protein n=1 Tax=Cryptotermes secundus TaxID=105785 RepID=A0A2J7QB40_9NEOP|nr:hypothetical protein B7P43_G11740 [Cryptotermes secundus]
MILLVENSNSSLDLVESIMNKLHASFNCKHQRAKKLVCHEMKESEFGMKHFIL